ncbi:MAG TPA: helix-turn-helix domain-containing protein [Pseudonocardiaceae bacterium]|nr:helix-turn-helix domain-containing protein [Pseudonocardiaceae bacterium]
MADESHPRIRDPKRLRALSHPLRWKMIKLIGSEETATATRCAEVLGESVASCSYHLNMLAKYDFVEEAEGGQGREKPWQLVSRDQSFSSEGLDDEGQLAAEAAMEAFLEQEFDAIRTSNRRSDREPEEWREALNLRSTSFYVTGKEGIELIAKVGELLDQYQERWAKPELRPEGARQLRVFLTSMLNSQLPGK